MRYIHFFGDNGYCGTDYHEFRGFNDSVTDRAICDISSDFAHDNAESFFYLATGWDEGFESEEEEEEYYENAISNCGWEELDKETWESLKEEYE